MKVDSTKVKSIALYTLISINVLVITAGISFWQGMKYQDAQTKHTTAAIQSAVKAATPVAAVPVKQ